MPTGYTAGILDGKINTFQEFATTCMRAFGACIHLRDEAINVDYIPQEVSPYYINRLQSLKERLEEVKSMSDEEIMKDERQKIIEEIEWREKALAESIHNKAKLEKMLADVNEWEPPTDEHMNFKSFMIGQLESTIKFDADIEYDQKELQNKQEQLNSLILDVDKIRSSKIEYVEDDIEYTEKKIKEDNEHVNINNEWVETLLKSLEYNER